jgi:hypothetical protein
LQFLKQEKVKAQSLLFGFGQLEKLLSRSVIDYVGIGTNVRLGIDKEVKDINAPSAVKGTNVRVKARFGAFAWQL